MSEEPANHAFAATFVDQLARSGLGVACISPGSRSAPLAMAFARQRSIRVVVQVDERSSGFFGLGLAKATGHPVVVLTTSGTAAAELHPAVLEARQSHTPLLVLTADRPPELREGGANQTVDQLRLFGSAPRWFHDPGPPRWGPGVARLWRRLAVRALAEAQGPPAGPVHLNLPFREPLTPRAGELPAPLPLEGVPVARVGRAAPPAGVALGLAEAISAARRPLIVAGSMPRGGGLEAALRPFLEAGAPLLAEPTSNLRRAGLEGVIEYYDALLRDPVWAGRRRPDLVLRLGAPPTSKALASWLGDSPAPTIQVDPERSWADPDNLSTELIAADPEALLAAAAGALNSQPSDWMAEWVGASKEAGLALDRALADAPLFEGHVVRALARVVPTRAVLVVGSSMAVRDVDSFWPAVAAGQRFLANRGASGIDGIVSTALGVAAAGVPTVALLGDLSLYHDMNGLWAARRHQLGVTFVVLDNDGGGIFSFLPPADHADVFEEVFATPLGLELAEVAKLYRLNFASVTRASQLEAALGRAVGSGEPWLVAVRFPRGQSVAAHRAAWLAVSGRPAAGS